MTESHLFNPNHVLVLEREDRKSWQNPEEILGKVEIRPNFIAADVGCGSGFFTLPLAKNVKKVYAIDVQKQMLERLEAKIEKLQLKNIELIFSKENEIPLEKGTVDILISVNTLHEFEDKDRMVAEMQRVLKQNGKALISDFKKKKTGFGPPVSIRLTTSEAIALFEQKGFQSLQTHMLRYHYLLVFSKGNKS
ncbi:MAG: class I SAM-dependent methyltransferase [Candidatus Heimdallarchaeota archaeon]